MSRVGSTQITYSIITEGTKTVTAAATPERLVAVSTPCKRVWVAAPMNDDGVATNTKVVRLHSGSANSANGYQVLINDAKGFYIPVKDAYDLYVDAQVNGEGVRFIVFG